ncbi:MAG: 4Fe-4S binding protein [Endomicrobium sp.]|jgi:ferredoxin|nr:4Fe-4S binding protein [Endomicrobium sp.]
MAYKIDNNLCVGCCACIGSCPESAIEQKNDKCVINSSKCVSCGICETNCPVSAIFIE